MALLFAGPHWPVRCFIASSVVRTVGSLAGTVGSVVTDGVEKAPLATQPLTISTRHSAPPAMTPLLINDVNRALFMSAFAGRSMREIKHMDSLVSGCGSFFGAGSLLAAAMLVRVATPPS